MVDEQTKISVFSSPPKNTENAHSSLRCKDNRCYVLGNAAEGNVRCQRRRMVEEGTMTAVQLQWPTGRAAGHIFKGGTVIQKESSPTHPSSSHHPWITPDTVTLSHRKKKPQWKSQGRHIKRANNKSTIDRTACGRHFEV